MIEQGLKKPQIIMRNKYGWKLYEYSSIKVWLFGHVNNYSTNALLEKISFLTSTSCANTSYLLSWAGGLSGNFSIVVEANSCVIAIVDKVCSNPIFIARCRGDIFISNYAYKLKKKCTIDDDNIDLSAGLEVYMSGFTIGGKTLYKNIERLEGGECLICFKNSIERYFYYTYSPWKTKDIGIKQFKNDLTNVFITMLKSLKNDAGERQIVIPLSAGNDSRLIASGLKELCVKNVVCFSYGRKGNFESIASKDIADRLGYKWIYIPVSLKGKRKFFKSDIYRKYVKDFDSFSSIPNTQEIYEIYLLKLNSLINDDAIIVNGNSGDFISGGHVIEQSNIKHLSEGIDWRGFLDKHYSLWGDSRNLLNDSYIIQELEKLLLLRNISIYSINLNKYNYAILECIECICRQSRIVINQQRTYEYFGYDWRLPLWSEDMLNFWESVPYKYKINQNLYIETLKELDFGGVWNDIKVNDKKIYPLSLRWLRMSFKVLIFPLGKKNWHRFEKKYFEYFLHPTYALSVVPYFKLLFNLNGYRNTSSWLSRKMLSTIDYFKK